MFTLNIYWFSLLCKKKISQYINEKLDLNIISGQEKDLKAIRSVQSMILETLNENNHLIFGWNLLLKNLLPTLHF